MPQQQAAPRWDHTPLRTKHTLGLPVSNLHGMAKRRMVWKPHSTVQSGGSFTISSHTTAQKISSSRRILYREHIFYHTEIRETCTLSVTIYKVNKPKNMSEMGISWHYLSLVMFSNLRRLVFQVVLHRLGRKMWNKQYGSLLRVWSFHSVLWGYFRVCDIFQKPQAKVPQCYPKIYNIHR